MPVTFTFVNTTLDDDTRLPGFMLSQVQSHLATVKQSRARAARRKLLKEENSHDPSAQRLVASHHATARIKQKSTPEAQRLMHDPKIEIVSSLDPFLRVPLDLSPQERSLVLFWLSEGRALFWGMSRHSPFCPSLHCTNALSDSSDIYILVQRLTAESLLCSTRQKELSPNFYFRRAQVYRAMNELLVDAHAEFHNKMAAFMTISVLEHILNRPDLQAKHVHAMDRYLENHGSMSELVSRTVNGEYLLDPPWYVAHFMFDTTPDYSDQGFRSILRRFMYSLQRIKTWASEIATPTPNTEPTEQQSPSLSLLRTYLEWVLEKHFINTLNIPSSLKCGPLHLLLGMCLTQVIYTYTRPTSLHFLQRAQSCFQKSSSSAISRTPEQGQHQLAAGAAAAMMGYIRYAVLPKDNEKEIEISQACIDAFRLLPLVSPETRFWLARNLRDCALAAVDGVGGECFGEGFVRDLSAEIESAWVARKGGRRRRE